jgi:hypothetical protein
MPRRARRQVHKLCNLYYIGTKSLGGGQDRHIVLQKTRDTHAPYGTERMAIDLMVKESETVRRSAVERGSHIDDFGRVERKTSRKKAGKLPRKRDGDKKSLKSSKGYHENGNHYFDEEMERRWLAHALKKKKKDWKSGAKSVDKKAEKKRRDSKPQRGGGGSGQSETFAHGTVVGGFASPIDRKNVGHKMLMKLGNVALLPASCCFPAVKIAANADVDFRMESWTSFGRRIQSTRPCQSCGGGHSCQASWSWV